MITVNVMRKKQNMGEARVHFHEDKAYTQYDIKKGDIIEDDFGRQFKIKSLHTSYTNNDIMFFELNYDNI